MALEDTKVVRKSKLSHKHQIYLSGSRFFHLNINDDLLILLLDGGVAVVDLPLVFHTIVLNVFKVRIDGFANLDIFQYYLKYYRRLGSWSALDRFPASLESKSKWVGETD